MAHSKLIEAYVGPTKDEDWTPIADIFTLEHRDLATTAIFAETFAKKQDLIHRTTMPNWVASERDVARLGDRPAYHWKSAHAHFEAPLGNVKGGLLHLSLTVQTTHHEQAALQDYQNTAIRIVNSGRIDNGKHQLPTPYQVIYDLQLFGNNPNTSSDFQLVYSGDLDALGERITVTYFGKGLEISYRKGIFAEPVDLFMGGSRQEEAADWAEHHFRGLDLTTLARLNPIKTQRLMKFLANMGIVAATPEEFWRKFSAELVR